MSVAAGQLRPQRNGAKLWTSHISSRARSQHRRMAVALLAMMILALTAIMGVWAFGQVAPAGGFPLPSGNAQPAPLPNR
jgi:type IV secretory pathway TrbF-like protein